MTIKKFFILIGVITTILSFYLLSYELFLLQGSSSEGAWILNALKKVHFQKVDPSIFQKEYEILPLSARKRIEVLHFLKVNINRASFEELVGLPRIGPAMAKRIIESRETLGPFLSLEDLKRVKGIGTKSLEALKDWITTDKKKSSQP